MTLKKLKELRQEAMEFGFFGAEAELDSLISQKQQIEKSKKDGRFMGNSRELDKIITKRAKAAMRGECE